jgi:hypothetical protein
MGWAGEDKMTEDDHASSVEGSPLLQAVAFTPVIQGGLALIVISFVGRLGQGSRF